MIQLGWNRDNRRMFSTSALNKFLDFFIVFHSSTRISKNEVNLILDNYNFIQLHNFYGSQMFRSLRLRTTHISSYKQKTGIHHSSTCQHSCHQDIVTRTIYKTDMSQKSHRFWTMFTWSFVRLAASITFKTLRSGTRFAFINLSIGITKFNSNISNFLVSKTHGLHSRNSFYYRRFSVSHMTNSSYILGRLTGNHFFR